MIRKRMIRKREEKEQFNLLFPIKILRNNISPSFPLLSTLPFPTTSTLMPLINTITSFSLQRSQFFVSLSSLPHSFPPKNLCPSTAAFLFHHYSIHSSAHHHRLRRSPYPHAADSASVLVAANRHNLMGENGFSDYKVSVSKTIRTHPVPMVGSKEMKRGGRNPDDSVWDEAKVVLGNAKVVHDSSSCTMGMVFDPTLSPPPKPSPWPCEVAKLGIAPFTRYSPGRDINGVGDKSYRFVSCCRRCGDLPFTYVYHSLQEICGASHASSGSYFHYKFFIDMAVRRLTEYIDDVIAKYLSVGDPDSCEKMFMQGLNVMNLEGTEGKSHFVFKLNAYTTVLDSASKLHPSAKSNSESSQIASLANFVPRVGGLIADKLIEHSEADHKTI